MSRVKWLIAGMLALLVLVVIWQNTAVVDTRLLFITLSMPRALLLMSTTLIGFLLGLLVSYWWAKQRQSN